MYLQGARDKVSGSVNFKDEEEDSQTEEEGTSEDGSSRTGSSSSSRPSRPASANSNSQTQQSQAHDMVDGDGIVDGGTTLQNGPAGSSSPSSLSQTQSNDADSSLLGLDGTILDKDLFNRDRQDININDVGGGGGTTNGENGSGNGNGSAIKGSARGSKPSSHTGSQGNGSQGGQSASKRSGSRKGGSNRDKEDDHYGTQSQTNDDLDVLDISSDSRSGTHSSLSFSMSDFNGDDTTGRLTPHKIEQLERLTEEEQNNGSSWPYSEDSVNSSINNFVKKNKLGLNHQQTTLSGESTAGTKGLSSSNASEKDTTTSGANSKSEDPRSAKTSLTNMDSISSPGDGAEAPVPEDGLVLAASPGQILSEDKLPSLTDLLSGAAVNEMTKKKGQSTFDISQSLIVALFNLKQYTSAVQQLESKMPDGDKYMISWKISQAYMGKTTPEDILSALAASQGVAFSSTEGGKGGKGVKLPQIASPEISSKQVATTSKSSKTSSVDGSSDKTELRAFSHGTRTHTEALTLVNQLTHEMFSHLRGSIGHINLHWVGEVNCLLVSEGNLKDI